MLKSIAKQVLYSGSGLTCPVCEKSARKFRRFGIKKRVNARCPWCGALERHRFFHLFLKRKTDLLAGEPRRLLHIAPEPRLASILRSAVGNEGYLSGDIVAANAMEQMDITDIHYPDDTFDVIYCSHVLEHVPEDRVAMREFGRVLKPGGWAILNVPITADQTLEDPSITDPKERERVYGQHDHVRRYGPDYADRLREAGFHVDILLPQDVASEEEIARYALTPPSGEIYYCTLPEPAS